MKIMQTLLDSVSDAYLDDPTAPGVVTSRFHKRGEIVYYASVVRYKERLGEGKHVVVKMMGTDMEQVITELSLAFKIFHESELAADSPARNTICPTCKGAKRHENGAACPTCEAVGSLLS